MHRAMLKDKLDALFGSTKGRTATRAFLAGKITRPTASPLK
jgi:hypothetical protein